MSPMGFYWIRIPFVKDPRWQVSTWRQHLGIDLLPDTIRYVYTGLLPFLSPFVCSLWKVVNVTIGIMKGEFSPTTKTELFGDKYLAPFGVAPIVGEMDWFQFYTPNTRELRNEILKRFKNAGFKTLVVAADVPAPSPTWTSESCRAGYATPYHTSLYNAGPCSPHWSIETLKKGVIVKSGVRRTIIRRLPCEILLQLLKQLAPHL